ncbi:MAG: transketolase [Alphaproteobacteria bacterium]
MHHPPNDLPARAAWLRRELFTMVIAQQQGHLPSSFSMAEILVTLYYGGIARQFPGEPHHPDRDRVIISKGHAAQALYPILADFGYFSPEELKRYGKVGGLLGIYADIRVPGIEGISGSLGHGLGMASGFALAARHDGRGNRSFVILGDGECYEGSIWESAAFAAHHRLDSVVTIVDRNKLCMLGATETLMAHGDLRAKWESFGWHAVDCDGHDFASLAAAFALIGRTGGRPLAIIADTVKGKGISFMEGHHEWHNHMPNAEQIAIARAELGLPVAED